MGLLQNIKNKLSDNEGWFRQGSFTPVKQIKTLATPQPLLSPVPTNSPQYINPATYQPTPSSFVEPTKPSFKTQAATELNNRLDMIKNFGRSVVQNTYDDKGMVRRGQFTPLAPIDDAFKQTTIGKVVNTVPTFINKRLEDMSKLPTSLVGAVKTNIDVKSVQKKQAEEEAITKKTFEVVRKLREMGRNDEANKMVLEHGQRGNKTNEEIYAKLDKIDNDAEQGKRDALKGGIATAETALSLYAGLPKIATNLLVGAGLNTGIAKLTGEDPYEAAATGMNDAFGYTGITSLITNPIVEKLLKSKKVISAIGRNPVMQQVAKRIVGALGNISEDELLMQLSDQRWMTPEEIATSGAMGAAVTGNEKIADILGKTGKKLLGNIPEPVVKTATKTWNKGIDALTNKKFYGNQYVDGYKPNVNRVQEFVDDGKGNLIAKGHTPTYELGNKRPMSEMNAFGGMAGVETYQDENGETKIRFNPEKAAFGIGAMAGIKSEAGQKAIKNLKIGEPPKGTQSLEDILKGIKETPEAMAARLRGKDLSLAPNEVKPDPRLNAYASQFDANGNPLPGSPNVKPVVKPITDILKPNRGISQIGGDLEQATKDLKQIDLEIESKKARGLNVADAEQIRKNTEDNVKRLTREWQKSPENKTDPNGMSDWLKREANYATNRKLIESGIPAEEVRWMPESMKQAKLAELNTPKPIKEVLEPVPVKEDVPVVPVVPVEEPKSPIGETAWDRQMARKEADLKAYQEKFAPLDEMLAKEGFDTKPSTEAKILAGETKASPELTQLIKEKNQVATENLLEVNPKFPKEKLKANYVPEVNKGKVSVQTDETPTGFAGMISDTTYTPTAKRAGMDEDKIASGLTGGIENKKAYLKKKYFAVDETRRIMTKYNLPKDVEDKVFDFVAKKKLEADSILTDHIEKTDFGKSRDYLKDAHAYAKELGEITGIKQDLPEVPVTHENWIVNAVDNLQSFIRGDAMFFKAKTNDEIYDAFIQFRKSQNGEAPTSYGIALNKFIDKLTSFDYKDPAVRERINLYIDSKLKENKVVQSTADKALRGISEVFSLAQIGGNVKTVITQPTETFRLIPEHGIKNFIHGIKGAFTPTEAKRLSTEYGLNKEVSGNLGINPLFKELEAIPKLKDKAYASLKNILFKGLAVTENWKNTAYASALENAGKAKGLEGEELKSFVVKEMLRLAHMADTDMTPQIMKNKALPASILQYSQYLLKNEVLKWDTIVAKDKALSEKLIKLTGLVLSDLAAVGTVAGVTGVAVDGAKGWFSNTGLPTSLGPIFTVPAQMATEVYKYSQLTDEQREKETSLMDKEMAIVYRNLVPMGNQTMKTKGALKIMDKGYAESKKGNVNYAVGDMNPLQKTQAFLFGQGAIPAKKEADKAWDNLDKTGIYPTLTSAQSETLKRLPKSEQKAYYDKLVTNKVNPSDVASARAGTTKKPGLIESILGGKKNKTEVIIPTKESTPLEKKQFNSTIKAILESGSPENATDEELKAYFFDEVDSLPESTASEKQNKTIERFKKLDSIYESDTLDQETKDRLIKQSGIPADEVEYYSLAKDDATVKAMRQEEKLSTMDRKQWLSDLEDGRRLVGNKQIVDNTTIDQLYERGALSDAERDYLKAVKYDPATSSYYLDRDYKNGQASKASAAAKKKLNAYQKVYDAIHKKSSDSSSSKTISQLLTSKVDSATPSNIGGILGAGKFKVGVTPKPIESSTVKRVTTKYRTYK